MTTLSLDPNLDTGTILIVDGDVLVRLALAEYLRGCGYRTLEASTAEEAMTVLQSPDFAEIDIAFVDAQAPGNGGGFAVAAWIRQNRREIDVLLVGNPAAAVETAAELCEDKPAFAKPFDRQLVTEKIRRMLTDRRARKTSAGNTEEAER